MQVLETIRNNRLIELQKKKDLLLSSIESLDKEIKKLQSKRDISLPCLAKELINVKSLKSQNTKGITIKIYKGEYQFILGGDGRSMPWSEKRKGTICEIETIYCLNEIQEKFIKDYIISIGVIDHFIFKDL